jgi:Ribonuclease G/E
MEPNKTNISEDQLKAIETEVQKKQAEALRAASESAASAIEEKVRKEILASQEAERLKEQLKKQEEETKRLKEDTDLRFKAQEDAFAKKLAEIEAQRKGIMENKSPFNSSSNPNIKKLSDGKEIDVEKLDYREIERQSGDAFLRYHNLPSHLFNRD